MADAGNGPGLGHDARQIGPFVVRYADPDDAAAIAGFVAGGLAESRLRDFDAIATSADVNRLLQTGHAILAAERDGEVCGVVRRRHDEGIAWFDLLLSACPGAGRALVRAVEMRAQESGIRLVRCRAPDNRLIDYFGWLGYLPVSREEMDGMPMLVLERRLPLLTVREQRREDADFVSDMTGRDSYPFEMGARPGWFIAADGDRPVGVVWVADAGVGEANIGTPVLLDSYRGRKLELWMLDRAVFHAQHGGYHTVQVEADQWLRGLRREMEERAWYQDGEVFHRRLSEPPKERPDW